MNQTVEHFKETLETYREEMSVFDVLKMHNRASRLIILGYLYRKIDKMGDKLAMKLEEQEYQLYRLKQSKKHQ